MIIGVWEDSSGVYEFTRYVGKKMNRWGGRQDWRANYKTVEGRVCDLDL